MGEIRSQRSDISPFCGGGIIPIMFTTLLRVIYEKSPGPVSLNSSMRWVYERVILVSLYLSLLDLSLAPRRLTNDFFCSGTLSEKN